MKCKKCGRKVRDSFTDKLNHVMTYHADRIIDGLSQWPQIGRAIGQHIGEQTKRLVMEYAKKRFTI